MRQIDILGRTYTIEEREKCDDEFMKENDIDGYTDFDSAEIVITKKETVFGKNTTLRHELIHAFLFESGLGFNWEHSTKLGHEETMVDWIATQWTKIKKVFVELGCDKDE